MALKGKTFYVDTNKGGDLTAVTDFIIGEIGLEGDRIEDLSAVSVQPGTTQLTVFYRTRHKHSVVASSPPPGAIIDIDNVPLHASLLFSDKLDPGTINSTAFRVDGTGVKPSGLYLETGNYVMRVALPKGSRGTSGSHRIEALSQSGSGILYENGEVIQHSAIVAYTISNKAAPQSGTPIPYTFDLGRMGSVVIESVITDKNTLPSDMIEEFLGNQGIDENRIIATTSVDISPGLVHIFFAYFKTLEPRLILAYPYNYSLTIDTSVPEELIFVFEEELDRNYIQNTDSLFQVIDSFNSNTRIAASDVSVDPDLKTVRVKTSNAITTAGIYDIRIENLKTAVGIDQTKSIIYSLQVLPFSKGADVITDHTLLSNIGTNTHVQIDTHLADDTKHRVIDDTSQATTDLWSASKITGELVENWDDLDNVAVGTTQGEVAVFDSITVPASWVGGSTKNISFKLAINDTPINGALLEYNLSNNTWEPTTSAAAGAAGTFYALKSSTGNITIGNNDDVILLDATTGPILATLPAVVSLTGKVYWIKRLDASANTITLTGTSSENIDGTLTKVISTQYDALTIINNGTGWHIL